MNLQTTDNLDTVGDAGPFESFADARSAHARLLRQRKKLAGRTLTDSAERLVRRLACTGAIVSGERERQMLQGLADYWLTTAMHDGADRDPVGIVPFDVTLAPELPESACPYLGLNPFGEDNAALFFGREALVAAGMERLLESSFLGILGPSGSGKSSILRAGLVPELRKGVGRTIVGPFMPGAEPLCSLGLALGFTGSKVEEFRLSCLGDKDKLLRTLERISDSSFIAIDQFEEVFTLCRDAQHRNAFLSNLNSVLNSREARVRHRFSVILALREDYLDYIAKDSELLRALNRSQLRVGPLEARELRDVILKPADKIGLTYASGIVDSLVADVVGEPAALPLLQFALYELWRRRNHNFVEKKAYDELGSPRLALANRADEVFTGLILEHRVIARRIFLCLVQFGDTMEVTSRRAVLSELRVLGGASIDVLTKFADARLLRTSYTQAGEELVEVAHEALIRNWPQLTEWLDEMRADLKVRARLRSAAEGWRLHDRDPGALLGGTSLSEAERIVDLTPLEEEYLRASRREVQVRKRRTGVIAVGAAVMALMVAGIVVGAADFFHRARVYHRADDESAQRVVELTGREKLLLNAAMLSECEGLAPRLFLPCVRPRGEAEALVLDAPSAGGSFSFAALGDRGRSVIVGTRDARVMRVSLPDGARSLAGSLPKLDSAPQGALFSGTVDGLGAVLYRYPKIFWWKGGELQTPVDLLGLLPNELLKRVQKSQPPIIEFVGSGVRVILFGNSQEGMTFQLLFISAEELLSASRLPDSRILSFGLSPDGYMPTLSGNSDRVAYLTTEQVGESGKWKIVVESLRNSGQARSLDLPGYILDQSDKLAFVSSFGFVNGSTAIAERSGPDMIRVLTEESPSSSEIISIPEAFRGSAPGPWPRMRPLLVGAETSGAKTFAWVGDAGIVGVRKRTGDNVSVGFGPLNSDLDVVNQLAVSDDGTILTAVQLSWGTGALVRSWDLGPRRSGDVKRYTNAQIISEECRAAGVLGSPFFSQEQLDKFFLGEDVQPCRGREARNTASGSG